MIAWVRKNLALLTACIVVVCLIVGGVYVFTQLNKPKLHIAGKTFTTEFKATEAERRQGLSGRKSLSDEHTMTFVFDNMAERCFWMKDMRFNIDIAWLDYNKNIVAIEQNVSPNTYPQNFCHNAQYVVEFNAGVIQNAAIHTGDPVIF